MPSSNFWSPVYRGNRFDNTALPLSVLEDLGALEELLFETAKEIYFEDHPDKKRLPGKFEEGVSLSLTGVESGSTKPLLSLAVAAVMAPANPTHYNYYDRAKDRIIEWVVSANESENNIGRIPGKYAKYFHKLGKSLEDDELIELAPKSPTNKAQLNKSLRERIDKVWQLRAVTSNAIILARVPTIDKGKNSFVLEFWPSDVRVNCNYNLTFAPIIKEAYDNYDKYFRVRVTGTAVLDNDAKIVGFEKINDAEVIYPLNIDERINELSALTDGWLEGSGKAPVPEYLDKIKELLRNKIDVTDYPVPRIYPTPEGGIQIEWTSDDLDMTLSIDPSTMQGYLHGYYFKNGRDFEEDLDLSAENSWVLIQQHLNQHQGLYES